MKKIHMLFAMVLLLASVLSHAHRDRRLTLGINGAIAELPVAYNNTRVRIVFAKEVTGLSELTFTSNGYKNSVSPCLLLLVKTESMDEVELSGSWHHNGALPHYVNIKFPDPGSEPVIGLKPGIEFLFSLQDARLISVQRVSVDAAAQTAQYTTIEPTEKCPRVN